MQERSHKTGGFVQLKANQNAKTPPAWLKFIVEFVPQGFEPIAALTAKEPSPFRLALAESERPTKFFGVRVCSFSVSHSG